MLQETHPCRLAASIPKQGPGHTSFKMASVTLALITQNNLLHWDPWNKPKTSSCSTSVELVEFRAVITDMISSTFRKKVPYDSLYKYVQFKRAHLKHKEVAKSEKKDLEILARVSKHTMEAESHFLLAAHFQKSLKYGHNTLWRYASG